MHGPQWLRGPIAVAGSFPAGAEIAVIVARHYPGADPLNRLYAGVFLGTGLGIVLLLWALFADGTMQVSRRVLILLAILTPGVIFWKGL